MWSKTWKIYGLLDDVQRRCCAQGCQRCYCNNQNKKNNSVCWLVSNRFQSGNQLSTSNCCPWWWLGQSYESLLHDLKHNSNCWGLLETGSQIRSHVCKKSIRSLVCRWRNVRRRIFRSKRRLGSSWERLRGGGNWDSIGRRRIRRMNDFDTFHFHTFPFVY